LRRILNTLRAASHLVTRGAWQNRGPPRDHLLLVCGVTETREGNIWREVRRELERVDLGYEPGVGRFVS
jgi:hypothetical protein